MRARRGLRWTLAAALVLTLVAARYAPGSGPQGGVVLAERSLSARAPVATVDAVAASAPRVLAIRERRNDESDGTSGFAPRQWTVPRTASAAAPVDSQVAAPQAPALPFRVLGRYREDDQEAVFLQLNDQNLVVRVGDTIADQYKVERLEGSVLTLRYLPLNEQQTLDVGAPK